MSKSQKSIIIFISIIFIFISLNIYAAGVRPMVFNFNLNPGDSKDLQLILTPGSIRENVILKLYNTIQKINGDLDYNMDRIESSPAVGWIKLEKEEVILFPGQESIVNAQINVPYNASGSHTVVVMIEEAGDENNSLQQMVNFKVRYAVKININIASPGQRARAEIEKIELNKNTDGNPQLSINLKNTSAIFFNAQAEATLRDQNNRLIERLDIISEAAARAKNKITRIYPNSEVVFQGELSQPIYPGEYILQVYLKYGDNQQLIERKNITIDEELRKSGPIRYISFEPEQISAQIKAGSVVTQTIELNNLYKEKINVKITEKEILDSNKNSIFNLGDLQLRGEEFIIDSRKSVRSVFILRSPRDAEAGGYYGQLKLEIFDKNNELLEQRDIDLEILIGDEWTYNTEIKELIFEKIEGVQHFSLYLKNLSSVHINPAAFVILKDDNDQIIKTINLLPVEDIDKLLPNKKALVTGRTADIKAGIYTAEIIINHQNKKINKVVTTVNIE
ncbi:MAG: hypothetical protein ACOCUD_04350 [Bacillota bacterium]